MAYKISEQCIGCQCCVAACPVQCIEVGEDGRCVIDSARCIECGTCASVCPVGAPNLEE